MPDLVYDAPSTVGSFMGDDSFVRMLVGPVGSGKSSGCCIEGFRRALDQPRGHDGKRRSRWAIIRNTYPQLRDTTRKTFEQWVPQHLGVWNEQSFTFTIRQADLDVEFLFRALDRPADVAKLLSLELTGAWVNEAREIPQHVFDVLQTRVGRYPSKAQGGTGWFGVWCDTNPWHQGHYLHRLFKRDQPEGYRLFEQPGGRSAEAENIGNLPAGYYDRLCHGKDSEWIECYVDGRYGSADIGSVYGKLLDALQARGGLDAFDHPRDGVYATLDLGISDATAIWFWRLNADGMPDLIDHYEATGEPMSHYWDRIDGSGFDVRRIWLPHDARARSLQTGASIVEQALKKYGATKVAITPELSLADGLQASRWLMEQPMRIHPRCERGLEALRQYRYTFDEERKVFSRTPEHDWSSHTADAFRYVAAAVRASDLMSRRDEPKPVYPGYRKLDSFSLEELHQECGRGSVEERI